jgi:hypothetical protein
MAYDSSGQAVRRSRTEHTWTSSKTAAAWVGHWVTAMPWGACGACLDDKQIASLVAIFYHHTVGMGDRRPLPPDRGGQCGEEERQIRVGDERLWRDHQ